MRTIFILKEVVMTPKVLMPIVNVEAFVSREDVILRIMKLRERYTNISLEGMEKNSVFNYHNEDTGEIVDITFDEIEITRNTEFPFLPSVEKPTILPNIENE